MHDDIGLAAKRLGITREEAASKYQSDLDSVGISIDYDRDKKGLNKVIGYSAEKLELLKKVIAPIVKKQKGEESLYEIPNGVLLYGQPGSGKSYMANALLEHIDYKSPRRDIKLDHYEPWLSSSEETIKTVNIDADWTKGDKEEIIDTLCDPFEQARRDKRNGYHTVLFINNMDKIFTTQDAEVLNLALKYETQKSLNEGLTWVATTNQRFEYLPNWLKEQDRTSIKININELETDAEMSAVLRHSISETKRMDKTDPDRAIDILTKYRIPRVPGKIKEVVDITSDRLNKNDYNVPNKLEKFLFLNPGYYKAPITEKQLEITCEDLKGLNY